MTRIICFVLLLSQQLTFGQTVIASLPVDLKNAQSHHRATTFSNRETGELFVMPSDKTRLHAAKLNSALFVRDTMSTQRPAANYDFIAGQAFSGENPEIYWMSADLKQVFAVRFDFEKKVTSTSAHTIPYDKQTYIGHFNTTDAFYVATVAHDAADLHFYEFSAGKVRQSTVSMSGLVNPGDKANKLSELFDEHALVKINTEMLSPLFYCSAKIKYYIHDHRFILTADHQPHETVVTEINLQDFAVNHQKIAHSQFNKPGKANSFFDGKILYQVKVNQEKIDVWTTDLATGTRQLVLDESAKSEITKRNSPLLSQTANRPARTLKNAERFLRAVSTSLPGISVYQTPDSKLVTIGGISYVASGSDIMLGVAAGVGMVLSGSDIYIDGLVGSENLRTVFYETHVDGNMQYVQNAQQLLAADKSAAFFNQLKGASLISTIRYDDFFICGYYLDRDRVYVIRKFTDTDD